MAFSPHPLLLPNIVSNILHHFEDTNVLESLRLVCHCWNEESCSRLRRLKQVQFSSLSSLEKYNDIFRNTVERCGAFPHSNYTFNFHAVAKSPSQSISHSNCDDDVDDDNHESLLSLPATVNDFLLYFGHQVNALHVSIGPNGYLEPEIMLDLMLRELPNISTLGLMIIYYNYQNANLRNYQFSPETSEHLRNVQSLIVQIDGVELEMYEDALTDLFLLLFRQLTCLRRITYPGDIRRISKTGLFLRDVILHSEAEDSMLMIRNVGEWNFRTRLLEDDALKFLCKDFPIKVLHIDLWNPDDDFSFIPSDLMGGLLRKWNRTLEHFVVEFPWRKEISFHFHFPLAMEKLTFLYLGGFEGSLLELLMQLPVLRSLELSQLELMSIVPKPETFHVFSSVKRLKLDFCNGQTGGILCRFSRIFPELRDLNLNHVTNEVARVIFQKMGALTRLRLQGNDLSDAGICGFSDSLAKEKNLVALTPNQGNAFRKYPFIANLKELQYLKLDAYELSEITVRHGLVHCISLRLVKIDCTARSSSPQTVCRVFRLSDYGKHLVEATVEMKEEPPLDAETLEFFSSHAKCSNDLVNVCDGNS